MKQPSLAVVALAVGAFFNVNAAPVSGFETGLNGWATLGDVTAQSSSSGLEATEGTHWALLTTLSTVSGELPFDQSSPQARQAQAFLGLPTQLDEFIDAMPAFDLSHGIGVGEGEGAAIKLRFYASGPGSVLFDWNRLGRDGDASFMSLWSDEPGNDFRFNDWIFNPHTYSGSLVSSQFDICSHSYGGSEHPVGTPCPGTAPNVESGWATKGVTVNGAGWYWIGFGMGEIAEGTGVTALALDNFRFEPSANIPEPKSIALVFVAILSAFALSARRFDSHVRR